MHKSFTNPCIYISEQFNYFDDLYKLKAKFDEYGWKYYNLIIPEHDQFDYDRKKQIEDELKKTIENCDIILFLARTSKNNSFWLAKEIEFCLEFYKKSIGIIPIDYNIKLIPLFIIKITNDDIINYNLDDICFKIKTFDLSNHKNEFNITKNKKIDKNIFLLIIVLSICIFLFFYLLILIKCDFYFTNAS
jgi:hypothetical protein